MIAALKEGDEFVFESVFHEYHEKIYLYILGKTQSPYLAEETSSPL
jgi:RNA polymerase sigma-70 factor (ECF subfamily)